MNFTKRAQLRPFARTQSGFTLIEMIAAIALMSLAMLAIAGGVGSAIASLLPSSHAIEASELAHAQLDPLCGEADLRAGTRDGTSNGNRWTLTISPGPSTDTVRLLMASLRVNAGRRRYQFDTVCAVSNGGGDSGSNATMAAETGDAQ